MKWITMLLMATALAACGAQGQQTPEPHETERIKALIDQLGTQRSYNSKTLIMNPDPDGVVLNRWLRRRQATLDGTLSLSDLPATSNPGSIADTIAWEQATEKRESGPGNRLGLYMVSVAHRAIACPTAYAREKTWFDKLSEEHRRGLHDAIVDWESTNAQYQALCDVEARQRQANAEAESQAAYALEAQTEEAAQQCRQPFEAVQAVYLESPNAQSGAQVTVAQDRMDQCLAAIGQQ
jgi:hypothetical protein